MAGQPHGIGTSLGQPIARVLAPSVQNVSSLPVTVAASNLVSIGTECQPLHKQASIVGLCTTQSPSQPLSSTTIVGRPLNTTLPLQIVPSHIPVSTTYHVPRGAAAVANISAPRSAVATPIVRGTSNVQATGLSGASQPTSFISSLRGLGPRTVTGPLTPVVRTTWLSSTTVQPASNIDRSTVFTQSRPASMTVTARPMGIQVNRIPHEPLKQQVLHTPGQKPIAIQQSGTPSQVQLSDKGFFKTTMSVQSSLGPVTIAQLLPARSQNIGLTYTNPLATFPLTSSHQLVHTTSIPRPASTVRHLSAPPGRLAVSTQGITTSVPGAIIAMSGAPRLATLPNTILTPVQNTTVLSAASNRGPVLTSHARLAVAPRGANPTVIATMGTAANTVISSAARLTVAPSTLHQANTLLTAQVITQSAHGPSIQLAQVPASSFGNKMPQTLHGVMPLQQTSLAITTMSNRSVPFTTNSTLSVSNIRPVAMTTTPARVYSQQTGDITLPLHTIQTQQSQQHTVSQQNILQGTNIYIQTSHKPAPAPNNSNPVFFYESASYQVAGLGGSLVARPYQAPSNQYAVQNTSVQGHQLHGTLLATDNATSVPASPNHSQALAKPNASPRPSILRKRDNEGSPMKAQKNLAPVLAALGGGPSSPPSPRRPDSRGNGGSSNGSTTISATSSPGLGEGGEDSQPSSIKQETMEESERPPLEMSPRKKPRKQQLTGNELHEPKFSEDDMEFISEEKVRKDIPEVHEEYREEVFVAKRPKVSLKNSYRHTWKSQNNHFIHYDNVKPKDTRPTVNDLANQKGIIEKLNGWKIFHLSTQMEEMSDLESNVVERLTTTLNVMEVKAEKDYEKDINRINELIKGNIQRSKVIKDQMQEAVSQVMKIFDHKEHVTDILSRCANKRSFKKREKS